MKFKLFITALISFAIMLGSVMTCEAKEISNKRHKKACKGYGKQMLKGKNNWKSYVRYR